MYACVEEALSAKGASAFAPNHITNIAWACARHARLSAERYVFFTCTQNAFVCVRCAPCDKTLQTCVRRTVTAARGLFVTVTFCQYFSFPINFCPCSADGFAIFLDLTRSGKGPSVCASLSCVLILALWMYRSGPIERLRSVRRHRQAIFFHGHHDR